jgi:hypothetical protein
MPFTMTTAFSSGGDPNMTRTQFQTYLVNNINRAITVVAASSLLVLLACSSSGRAASEPSKSAPAAAQQPMQTQAQPLAAKLESVSSKSASPVVHRASVGTLRNDDFGITLEYPWQYGFKSGHKLRLQGEQVETSFVAPGGINLGVIEIPAGYYEKTDFERAFLSANVNRKLTSDQCSQFADMSDGGQNGSQVTTEGNKTADSSTADASSTAKPAIASQKVKVGDQEYLMVEQKSDNSTLRTYHSYQNGVCYEFVLGLKTNDNDGSDSDQIKPVSPKQVFARLEKILATADFAPDAENGAAVAAAPATGDVPPQKP